jgi:CHRD domain
MRTRVLAGVAAMACVVPPTAGLAAGSAAPQLSASLRGSAEVPKGSPTGSGVAKVTLNTKTSRACWRISVRGIGKPLSAHVHKARPGRTGNVVIPLGAKYMTRGCVLVPLRTIRAVAKNPNGYYVNVHTRTYLGGAIRGQLHS